MCMLSEPAFKIMKSNSILLNMLRVHLTIGSHHIRINKLTQRSNNSFSFVSQKAHDLSEDAHMMGNLNSEQNRAIHHMLCTIRHIILFVLNVLT